MSDGRWWSSDGGWLSSRSLSWLGDMRLGRWGGDVGGGGEDRNGGSRILPLLHLCQPERNSECPMPLLVRFLVPERGFALHSSTKAWIVLADIHTILAHTPEAQGGRPFHGVTREPREGSSPARVSDEARTPSGGRGWKERGGTFDGRHDVVRRNW